MAAGLTADLSSQRRENRSPLESRSVTVTVTWAWAQEDVMNMDIS